MKTVRFFIVSTSLFLAVWLSAAFHFESNSLDPVTQPTTTADEEFSEDEDNQFNVEEKEEGLESTHHMDSFSENVAQVK